jgi:hypothetical protein
LNIPPDNLIGAGAMTTAINSAIERAGGATFAGQPLGPPQDIPGVDWTNPPLAPGARPQYQNYSNGGTVYWSPIYGAHFLSGPIGQKYQSLVLQQGIDRTFGYPSSDILGFEPGQPGKVVRLNGVDGATGAIFWDGDPNHGAFLVNGKIAQSYAFFGEKTGPLGFPTSDPQLTYTSWGALNGGRYNLFQNGAIYQRDASSLCPDKTTCTLKASILYGPIYRRWTELGATQSTLGFPVADVFPVGDGGSYGMFEGGLIYGRNQGFAINGVTHDRGQSYASGSFAALYLASRQRLGYPVDEAQPWGDDARDNAHHWAPSHLEHPGGRRNPFDRQLFDQGILYLDPDVWVGDLTCHQIPDSPKCRGEARMRAPATSTYARASTKMVNTPGRSSRRARSTRLATLAGVGRKSCSRPVSSKRFSTRIDRSSGSLATVPFPRTRYRRAINP